MINERILITVDNENEWNELMSIMDKKGWVSCASCRRPNKFTYDACNRNGVSFCNYFSVFNMGSYYWNLSNDIAKEKPFDEYIVIPFKWAGNIF